MCILGLDGSHGNVDVSSRDASGQPQAFSIGSTNRSEVARGMAGARAGGMAGSRRR